MPTIISLADYKLYNQDKVYELQYYLYDFHIEDKSYCLMIQPTSNFAFYTILYVRNGQGLERIFEVQSDDLLSAVYQGNVLYQSHFE